MNTVAIIQARMGSSRLPGKVLLPLGTKPAIEHVVERASMIEGVTEVVLATSVSETDNPLADFCESKNISLFRGSEEDVLDRYFKTAAHFHADVVMRINGDCPLLDPAESAKVLCEYRKTGLDYVSNVNPPTLPDGLDTEVFSFPVLQRTWEEAKKTSEREHVTLHIYSNPEEFRIASVTHEGDYSRLRWTLDEKRDYEMLRIIFQELHRRKQFGYLPEVLEVISDMPQLSEMNSTIGRNEGLQKSLREDGQAF